MTHRRSGQLCGGVRSKENHRDAEAQRGMSLSLSLCLCGSKPFSSMRPGPFPQICFGFIPVFTGNFISFLGEISLILISAGSHLWRVPKFWHERRPVMGSLFSTPSPPGRLPAPPNPPNLFDPRIAAMRRQRLEELKRKKGRQATILTSGLGPRAEAGPAAGRDTNRTRRAATGHHPHRRTGTAGGWPTATSAGATQTPTET